MPKYARGINREIVGAVNQGVLAEPLTIEKIRAYSISRGWDVPDPYIVAALCNGASSTHSLTWKKYFVSSVYVFKWFWTKQV